MGGVVDEDATGPKRASAQDDVHGFGVHFADQQLGTVDSTGHWRPWDDETDDR
ncbi:hypothetical protein [Streptomyces hebeiensis]